MPTLSNYVVITDNAITLPAGNVQNFAFDAPALNTAAPTILLFRVFPTPAAGLELTINGSVVFTVPAFNVAGGRSLHEVFQGLVLPAGNMLIATNTGAADVNITGVTLLFQT